MAQTDQNVFLTGASSGIGLETARLLASNNFSIWGTSREIKRLPSLQNFHPVIMDLTEPKTIRENFSAALKEAGHFDALINNSGAGWFGPVEMQSDEILREQFQLMVHGPLELIRLTLPQMRERKKGHIINVTSLAARFPIPYLGPYSSTKAALSSLCETLRHELANTGVHVTDVQPGDIRTNFHVATKRIEKPSIKEPRMEIAWKTIDRNMAAAPPPQIVARAILRVLNSANPPPIVAVGSFFQASLGPLFARFAPQRLSEWILRKYYWI